MTSFRKDRERQRGFTLAELLISLAVATMLLAIAVPSYSSFVRNSRQVSTANELLSSLHAARDLAITQNVRVTMCPSSGGADCEAVAWDKGWIVFIDTDGDGTVDAGEDVRRSVSSIPALSIASEEFDAFVIFRPNGRAMVNTIRDNTGELTLCDERGGEHARVVIVDISGRPRVSRTKAAGGEPVCA